MLTDSSFSNNPGEANEEHDTPDIQHTSYLWVEGSTKNDVRSDSGTTPRHLCDSSFQALLALNPVGH